MSDRIPIIAKAHVSERAARTLYVTLLAGDPGTASRERPLALERLLMRATRIGIL